MAKCYSVYRVMYQACISPVGWNNVSSPYTSKLINEMDNNPVQIF